jgi:serine/threonine protein kinase
MYPLHRIVYRDLKPDNIGFDVRGDVKLFDFGLARELPNQMISNGMYKMTADTGSPRYMAPEIALEQPYNEKGDVYSFAILLHQICSLEMPFSGYSKNMFAKLVVNEGHRPKCDPNWPQELQSMLQTCWGSNISQRLSMSEVMEILSALIEKETGKATRRSLNFDVSGKTQRSIRLLKGK